MKKATNSKQSLTAVVPREVVVKLKRYCGKSGLKQKHVIGLAIEAYLLERDTHSEAKREA